MSHDDAGCYMLRTEWSDMATAQVLRGEKLWIELRLLEELSHILLWSRVVYQQEESSECHFFNLLEWKSEFIFTHVSTCLQQQTIMYRNQLLILVDSYMEGWSVHVYAEKKGKSTRLRNNWSFWWVMSLVKDSHTYTTLVPISLVYH